MIKTPEAGDRFIPVRQSNDLLPSLELTNNPHQTAHNTMLMEGLLGVTPATLKTQRLLFFSQEGANKAKKQRLKIQSKYDVFDHLSCRYPCSAISYPRQKNIITLSTYKILDVPDLLNDFYCNLLSWSDVDRIFTSVNMDAGWAIASSPATELKSDKFGEVVVFTSVPTCHPTAVLAVGEDKVISGWSDGSVKLYVLDQTSLAPCFEQWTETADRIESIIGMSLTTFACGYQNGQLSYLDLRKKDGITRQNYELPNVGNIHLSGLAYDGEYCLASGSNDNAVRLWDIRALQQGPYFTMTAHQAAVKALAFHPQNTSILLSGGGTACTGIYETNTKTTESVLLKKTSSQVTGLHWFPSDPRYLASSHGYGDHHPVQLWSYQAQQPLFLEKKVSIPDHRALFLAGSKDKPYFAVATSGEALHFFKANGVKSKSRYSTEAHSTKQPMLASCPLTIR